jgi:hypothetical protein
MANFRLSYDEIRFVMKLSTFVLINRCSQPLKNKNILDCHANKTKPCRIVKLEKKTKLVGTLEVTA